MAIPPIELDSADLDRIESLVDMAPIAEALKDAVEELPPLQAAAIKLRVSDDRSYPEVARLLGCTEGAARVRVSRGLRTLAALLEER